MIPLIILITLLILIIIWWIATRVQDNKVKLSIDRQEKRYRYQQNIEMIPVEWKRFIHTEKKQGVRELQSLDDFQFVFQYVEKWQWWCCIWPTITADNNEMVKRLAELKRNYFSN